jgi:MFS family permease
MFNVIILGLTSLLTDISTEMVYPLLPLFLTSARIGATPAIVGMIEGLAESAASLLRVFSGYWSDRLQQRKGLAIAGYSGSVIGKVFLYLAAGWPMVLFGRLVDRFGKGIRTAPRDALIADSSAAAQRGNAFGLHRAMDSAGASIGVLIGYVLLVSLNGEFSTIFMLSIIPALLGVLVLFLVREKVAPARSAASRPPREAWWRGLGQRWRLLDRRLKVFLLIIFLFTLGNSSNQFLLLRAKDRGFDNATVILMYLVFNIVYTLAAWPAGRLSDRVGRKPLLVAGYATYGAVYLGFAALSPAALWGLFAAYGLYIALTEGVEKALVSDMAPRDLRATLIGLHATFTGIGLLPASVVAGVLWNAFGAAAPFYFGGAMGGLAALALFLLI